MHLPTVVASLWSVPDAPTADLMVEFYRQLQQNPDKAQALRQAMLITRRTQPIQSTGRDLLSWVLSSKKYLVPLHLHLF